MKSIMLLLGSACMFTLASAAEMTHIRFLIESLPDGMGEVTWVAGEKHGDAIKLSADQLSAPVMVPLRVIGLKSLKDNRALAKITLPETGNAFVVLLLPEGNGSLKPMVIPANDASFRPGDVFLCNHSDKTIIGHLGTTEFELTPGQGKPVRPVAGPSLDYYNVEISVRDASGERVLRTMRWPIQTRSRSYVFFAKNPLKNRIEFRAVDEFVEVAPSSGTKK